MNENKYCVGQKAILYKQGFAHPLRGRVSNVSRLGIEIKWEDDTFSFLCGHRLPDEIVIVTDTEARNFFPDIYESWPGQHKQRRKMSRRERENIFWSLFIFFSIGLFITALVYWGIGLLIFAGLCVGYAFRWIDSERIDEK